MSFTIVTDISKIDTEKWYDFLLNHPYGNVFQNPFMFKVYADSLNHQPYVFVAFVDDEIVGILLSFIQKQFKGPLSSLSARSVIWGGPIAKDNNPEILEPLLISHDKLVQKKSVYTQIRNLYSTNFSKKLFSDHKYLFEEHLNIILDISQSEDELWKRINSKGRNKIRIAQRNNCTFKAKQDKETLLECYEMIKHVYKKAKLPLNDKEFFLNLLNYSDKHTQLKIFAAYHHEKLIACRLALLYNNYICDFYAGSDKSFYTMHPNDFLLWEIFKWGKENTHHFFDFGGAGKPDIPYGVRDYKKKFGGEIVNFGRYEKIQSGFKYSIASKGFHLWQQIMHKTNFRLR